MIKLKKPSPNVILGITLGIIVITIINLETTWLYYAVEDYGINISQSNFDKAGVMLSIVIFIFIIAIFKFAIKRITHNLILGSVVGMVINVFISIQGSWTFWAIKEQGVNLNPITFEAVIILIYIIIFISSIVIFNNKRFKKVNLNKISIYLLLAILISLIVASILVMVLASKVLYKLYLQQPLNLLSFNLATNALFAGGIGTFILIFLSLVNRKVKYIKFLTKEVKKIKEDGFGKTIKVQGKDELAQLCESINSMSIELKEKIDNERKLENNKNELITNVSHDLRTPLTSIMGYIDLIKKGEYKDREQFDEYVNIIDQKSKNLNKLINELFEYTKLNNYDIKLNYCQVDIVALVEQFIGEYVYIFNKEGFNLIKDTPNKDIYINIDIEKIARVLENLLSNAKKYSISNSDILLTLKEENKNVIISVSNKTNEIKEDQLSSIFERFYKGDKSRKETESSGLGLSIAKRIVELHKGSIDVCLNDDIISFHIKLPLQ